MIQINNYFIQELFGKKEVEINNLGIYFVSEVYYQI